jgi:uncharacterized membrane protein (UPF0127 family)
MGREGLETFDLGIEVPRSAKTVAREPAYPRAVPVIRRILSVLCATAVAAAAPAAAAGQPAPVRFGHGTVRLAGSETRVRLRVEVARTSSQIERGLMYRRQLGRSAGMLFLFRRPTREWFWMKHTLVPLSIAFFDRHGRIVRLYDMPPCRRDPCRHFDPGRAVSGALEVRWGAYRRWRIGLGDTVVFAVHR